MLPIIARLFIEERFLKRELPGYEGHRVECDGDAGGFGRRVAGEFCELIKSSALRGTGSAQ